MRLLRTLLTLLLTMLKIAVTFPVKDRDSSLRERELEAMA